MIAILYGLIALMITATAVIILHFKTQQNESTPQNKKKQKLLRFQRGNKTLTPSQQRDLDRLNANNIYILKQMWKDEHL